MKIDLYTRCWNEADMLPFLFRHYDGLVQRYVVFDDGSSDRSLELLRLNPKAETRPMPLDSHPDSRVASGMSVLESCWKESRGLADWVIVTDIDEHLYHRHIAEYLDRCKRRGVTIVPGLGYQMVSEDLPGAGAQLSRAVTLGAPFPIMNKLNIFAPDRIEATCYDPGRHTAQPQGHVVAPARDELLLLHYKYLDFERTFRRYRRALTRQRPGDFSRSWGFQYSWTREELRAAWDEHKTRLVDVSDPDLNPCATHPGSRWWRDNPDVMFVEV